MYENYYTITLTSRDQAKFAKGRGTREQIFNLKQKLDRRTRNHNKTLLLLFLDCKKSLIVLTRKCQRNRDT